MSCTCIGQLSEYEQTCRISGAHHALIPNPELTDFSLTPARQKHQGEFTATVWVLHSFVKTSYTIHALLE